MKKFAVESHEVLNPSRASIEMVSLTSFDLIRKCDKFIFKDVCAN